MKVGVIGAGAWGTALAILSARSENDVILWSFDGEHKDFDGVDIPKNLSITKNMEDLTDCKIWLMVTPASFFRETIKKAKNFYANQPILICTKGAESSTGQFMSEILETELPECKDFGVLSGPQFAAEVAQGVPTGSTLAGGEKTRLLGKEALSKMYLSDTDDVIGAELCGAGKNAVSLICGYNSVIAAGENERALKLTRAWNEVVKIGLASGAKETTFLDLCGIGDLFLSATSVTSRNFSGGIALAKGEELVGTVEGVFAISGLIKRAERLNVETPILREMKEKMKI